MKDHDQAAERLDSARRRRDRHVGRYEGGRGSPGEVGAYTQLQAAVEEFAAREASLARLDYRSR